MFDGSENVIVSELVDAESLRDAKPQKSKTVDIVTQIADGPALACLAAG